MRNGFNGLERRLEILTGSGSQRLYIPAAVSLTTPECSKELTTEKEQFIKELTEYFKRNNLILPEESDIFVLLIKTTNPNQLNTAIMKFGINLTPDDQKLLLGWDFSNQDITQTLVANFKNRCSLRLNRNQSEKVKSSELSVNTGTSGIAKAQANKMKNLFD